MKKILFAASEVVPFIKTGGLADVVGSLPKYFSQNEYDVRVILPKYRCMQSEYEKQLEFIEAFTLELGWRQQYVGLFKLNLDGITYYFIDNEFYFAGDRPYNEIYMDIEKFSFFSKAVLAALPHLNFQADLIHCNDWQTALIPVYLKSMFHAQNYYRKIRTVLSIHNLKFQGVWGIEEVKDATGLPWECFGIDGLEAYGAANLLKGGIEYADFITTVSETYAHEIQTEFFGEGLDGLLRSRSHHLTGIVNGLDYSIYDPEHDSLITQTYSTETFQTGKAVNKAALQESLGLDPDPDVMLIGIVSRLTDQKGFDLIDCVMDDLCADHVQFVILGTGEARYEDLFRHFAWRYPTRISANIRYNEALSHQIYAACDAFLMPSLFEPCGLSQLMSLRYGTLPIVRETGGLKDTVSPYDETAQTGTGFTFANYNAHEMLAIVRYAETTYYDHRDSWDAMVKRAMERDYSWTEAADRYAKLYQDLLRRNERS